MTEQAPPAFTPRRALKPLYTLFDNEARPDRPKLGDDWILEMVVLYDYTTSTVAQLARAFDLPEEDVERFFYTPALGSPSVARGWLRALSLSQDDAKAIRRIAGSAAVRLQVSLDHGVNYVEHTLDVFRTIQAAIKAGKPDGVPEAKTMEDVLTAQEFYTDAAKDVVAILARAKWPEVKADDDDDDDDDFTDDEDCEVIEDGDDGKDDLVDAELDDDDVVQMVPNFNNPTQRAAARAWHYTAH